MILSLISSSLPDRTNRKEEMTGISELNDPKFIRQMTATLLNRLRDGDHELYGIGTILVNTPTLLPLACNMVSVMSMELNADYFRVSFVECVHEASCLRLPISSRGATVIILETDVDEGVMDMYRTAIASAKGTVHPTVLILSDYN